MLVPDWDDLAADVQRLAVLEPLRGTIAEGNLRDVDLVARSQVLEERWRVRAVEQTPESWPGLSDSYRSNMGSRLTRALDCRPAFHHDAGPDAFSPSPTLKVPSAATGPSLEQAMVVSGRRSLADLCRT